MRIEVLPWEISCLQCARPRGAPDRRRRRGFTLIELLVVIAIIGLLISLLTPSLGRARDRAREIGCASKERNIGVAIMVFALDNDGWLPQMHSRHTSPWWFPDYSWTAQLWPYLGGGGWAQFARFFACPSDQIPHRLASTGDLFRDSYDGNPGYFSYGYNMSIGDAYTNHYGIGGWPPGSPHVVRKKLTRIPSDGIILAEARYMVWITLGLNPGFNNLIGSVKFTHGSPGGSSLEPVGWSVPYGGGDRANFLHADGSVRAYSINEVANLPLSRWRFD